MQTGFRRAGVLLCVTALIISTILNILYRMEYYQMGVNFIYTYQTSYQTGAITVIQNIISILGNTFFIVAFLIVVHLLAYRKLASVVYIFYIVCNAYLIAVEKQAYQDPRPFSYNPNIQSLEWTCPRSYGFPSGHSWVSVLLYEPVVADFIGTVGWRKIILFWIILTGTLIPISRQYLGSHTADQVTSGVLHSMSALILYKCFLQDCIYRLLARAFKGISMGLLLTLNTIFFGLSIAVPFIIYRINV
jgi:membrane-associated phospholipid phosphatase